MHGIILYKSRYGSTKQYAEWLQEETGFELCDIKQCPDDLSQYDTVVIGSSILAGRVALTGWISRHWPDMQGKRVFLLLTNVTANQEELAQVVPRSLPPEIAAALQVFPVGGRYAVARMRWFDRTLIRMVSSMEKRPEVKRELLEERDWVNRDQLRPLLAAIRGEHDDSTL